MFRKISIHIIILIISIFGALTMRADAYRDYINKYANMAIGQMDAFGIPASITLAQGILESGAGRSTLAREGNNHFGIKCHSDWTGRSMLRNDDKPNECFRVYMSVEDSFRDHSLFLRRKRYASLFDLPINDYKGWAKGLKACGYATDPNYAERLISIIELYSLNEFDKPDHTEMPETAAFIHKMLSAKHVIRKNEGLHYVIAQPGDTYSLIAHELNMNLKKLLSYNDCEKDGEVRAWEEVYLQEKNDYPLRGESYATIGDGENLHTIAQRFGMKEASIRRLNPNTSERPGNTLRLK